MKITVLDRVSFTNGDIDFSSLENFGEVSYYDILPFNELVLACKDADIVVCNKAPFDKKLLDCCKKLKLIAIAATGYNNTDLKYAKEKGIIVCNVPGYSTVDVAQHVFAFILHYANKVYEYDMSVKSGDWLKSKTFCYFNIPLCELKGKTLGIIGYGDIGSKVAKIAESFNMNVIVSTRTKKDMPYKQVSLEQVFKNSDFLTLHCPLNDSTRHLVNKNTLGLMKKSAVLINTSRGGVINEDDLKWCLDNNVIAHAMLDVLTYEPMKESCVLRNCKNITFTPHIAWACKESRQRLIDLVSNNIQCFLNNMPINVVN